VPKHKKDNSCKSIIQKSGDYIFNYQMTDNIEYLDSALIIIEEAIGKCSKNEFLLKSRKMDILLKKGEYSKAIIFVESFEKPLIEELNYYNKYLIQRFSAMQYHFNGNIARRDDCLKTIILMLEKFLKKNKNELDLLLLNEDIDELLRNSLSLPYLQCYYMKFILLGEDEIKHELDSLTATSKVNEELIEFIFEYSLDNDIMDFNGI